MSAFNGWIVIIRKGSRHEVIRQRGFANRSESEDRYFAVDQSRIFILAHVIICIVFVFDDLCVDSHRCVIFGGVFFESLACLSAVML